jgi:leucyl aminopeptidase
MTLLLQEECEKLGMGSYLAVQKGSKFPPRFLHLTYRGKSSQIGIPAKKIALVGKGLTFDRYRESRFFVFVLNFHTKVGDTI